MVKKISLLGSTGSIGTSTLRVVRHLKDELKVTALAAHSNIALLAEQIIEFKPQMVAVYDPKAAMELQKQFPDLQMLTGIEGMNACASDNDADIVLASMSGTLGVVPTLAAIEAGKTIALANKEVLVAAGELVMQRVKSKGVKLLPVDSEHSALFQCLEGQDPKSVRRLIITASGGPFRSHTMQQLSEVTLDQALNHPKWKMGPKITIDSSTLMNKGLEVIEAHWLFEIPVSQIDVVVHPQSIIHSMVEHVDGSILAQMGEPDMIVPIQYALTYPERRPGMMKPFDFIRNGRLEFTFPDQEKFRCLSLAYSAIKQGQSLPCYLNAANEVLVGRFLQKQISWLDISQKLETLLQKHTAKPVRNLEAILEIDRIARFEAAAI